MRPAIRGGQGRPAEDGCSPLHSACYYGHKEAARALLSAGAKVDLQNKLGMPPLYMACQEGHTEVARVLLSMGAKVDLLMNYGRPPCTQHVL